MDLSQRRGIPPFLHSLVKNLRFDNNPIILAGTAGLATQQYFSDYDLLSVINGKYSPKKAYEIIKHILTYSEKVNDLYFIEFKLQTKKGKKLKYSTIEELDEKEFLEYFKDADFIKLDFILRAENKYTELSIIYSFRDEQITDEEFIKSLVKDIDELREEGNNFKALKRIFAIYNNKYIGEKLKNTEKYKFLGKFFNTEYGKLYQTTANLKAIKLLLENYDDEETIKRALHNLKELGIEPDLDNIDNIIKKNEKEYNGKAKEILSQLKNIK